MSHPELCPKHVIASTALPPDPDLSATQAQQQQMIQLLAERIAALQLPTTPPQPLRLPRTSANIAAIQLRAAIPLWIKSALDHMASYTANPSEASARLCIDGLWEVFFN